MGISESVFSLILTAKLFLYLDKHPEKEDWFLLGGFILCWIGIAYITLKPYPADYNEEGKLIVDSQKMMIDGYGDIGKVIGFIIARFVEKKWIKFQSFRHGWLGAVICAVLLIPMVMLKSLVRPVMTDWLGAHWGRLAFSVTHAFYYIALVPLLLKLSGKILPALKA